MADTLLTSAQVARLLGVTSATVKRWSDAGLIRCARTAGAHRRFDPVEVSRFARAHGMAEADPGDAWADRLLDGGDPLTLHAALLGERARLGAWWLVADVVGRAVHAVGDRWAAGRITILEEHASSERLLRALSRAVEGLPARPGAPRLLLASAEGDEHTLGLALAELVAREWGWATVWAGRGAPTAELARAMAAREADVLALSASVVSRREALAAEVAALGPALRDAGAPLLLGGGGPWPDPPAHGVRVPDFRTLRAFLAEHDHRRSAAGEGLPP